MFKDYNMNQLIVPLDLEVKLQKNNIAFHMHHLVESTPHETLEPLNEGCPAYHPRMMLKIILCAYTQSVFLGRKIEALLQDSIRMMWLAQGYEPSYRTIIRFRFQPEVIELIRRCFVQFRCQLVQEKNINQGASSIDRTKIEANALNLLRGSLSVAITFVKGETTTFLQEHKNSLAPYHSPIIEE